jgi:tRNA threonylcarbamoyladenosine biosynthesis protein TsaE
MNIELKIFNSNSEEDTENIALDFLSRLNLGDTVVLNGPLGSGKTFFVKKITDHFKIKNSSSPTFAIVNEYIGERKIYHFDFFRINSINELHDIGFGDYLSDTEAIVFIEWGELFPDILPRVRYEIQINFNENNTRKFVIKKYE